MLYSIKLKINNNVKTDINTEKAKNFHPPALSTTCSISNQFPQTQFFQSYQVLHL